MSADAPVPADLTGQFLIAETDLQDPNFFRTVVLIIQHNEEGAFGLVINRQSDVLAGEVIEEVADSLLEEQPVFVGGPVQQNYVFALHDGIPERYRSEHCEQPGTGVFFEPSFQHVIDYVRSEDYRAAAAEETPSIKVLAGYSGWGPGQLEAELEEEAWYLNPASADVIFETGPAEGWKEALSRKGGYYRIVAQTGFKPSIN